MNEPVDQNEIKPFRDLKLLNQACLNLNAIEDVGTAPVMSRITAMGGWPTLLASWDGLNWSWERTIANLRANGYSVSYIFTFSVTTDQQNSTRRIGRVSEFKSFFYYKSVLETLQ